MAVVKANYDYCSHEAPAVTGFCRDGCKRFSLCLCFCNCYFFYSPEHPERQNIECTHSHIEREKEKERESNEKTGRQLTRNRGAKSIH